MKIAFIGTGNMGSALAKAASKVSGNEIFLVDSCTKKAEDLSIETRGTVTDCSYAVMNADIIFLGVKPNALPSLCNDIKPILQNRTSSYTVVSMAAGVMISSLIEMLGDIPIIRIMPNTPVSVCEGVILYSCLTNENVNDFLNAMKYAGKFMYVDEKLIDIGMAVSGCGPAFACIFVDAIADAGVAGGLSRSDAIELAAQMMLGSAKLILESDKTPAELKDAVCSPGGTTIKGVRKLEEKGFRSAVIEAVLATINKN